MENAIKMNFHAGKHEESAVKEVEISLLAEIKDVQRQLSCTERWFQMESDEDLIDACIYQREVLNARYRYLMRKAKRDKVYFPPFQK